MTDTETINRHAISLQKAVLWEQVKGLLRAMVAADGCRTSGTRSEDGLYRFEEVSLEVEAFIKDFEDKGMNE
jgi:hypothetical protein